MKKALLSLISLLLIVTGITALFNACEPGKEDVFEDDTYTYTKLSCEPVTQVTLFEGPENQEAYTIDLASGSYSQNGAILGQLSSELLNKFNQTLDGSCSCEIKLKNTTDLVCTLEYRYPTIKVSHLDGEAFTYVSQCFESIDLCDIKSAQQLEELRKEFKQDYLTAVAF